MGWIKTLSVNFFLVGFISRIFSVDCSTNGTIIEDDSGISSTQVPPRISFEDIFSNPKYDKTAPKGDKDLPTVETHIRFGTPKVNEDNEELSFDVYVKMLWNNEWFADLPDTLYTLNEKQVENIWIPETWIEINDIVVQRPAFPRAQMTIIVHRSNFSMYCMHKFTLSCRMDFLYYPAEKFNCTMKILIEYTEASETGDSYFKYGGEADNPNYFLNFLKESENDTLSEYYYSLELSRKPGYHILQMYVPSSLLVILSLMSLIMEPDSISDRLALCTTTLITMTALFNSVREGAPKVSYIKALDIWMVVCIGFVFVVLLENIAVCNVVRDNTKAMRSANTEKKKRKKRSKLEYARKFLPYRGRKNRVLDTESGIHEETNNEELPVTKYPSKTKTSRVKVIDRILFTIGLIFILAFFFGYWLWLNICVGGIRM